MHGERKLNYKQYKHLIDVFTTGGFLIESLNKKVGLITYRNLLTHDNVLYFTQNSERTCKIPIGLDLKRGSLSYVDLTPDNLATFLTTDDTENYFKVLGLEFLQLYNPSEYIIYHDIKVKEFEELNNFQYIGSERILERHYLELLENRRKKFECLKVKDYCECRKVSKEPLAIFILSKESIINKLEEIMGNNKRYGISRVYLNNNENGSNYLIPKVTEYELNAEINEFREMSRELFMMEADIRKSINLLTGEYYNGDTDNLIIKSPLDNRTYILCDCYGRGYCISDVTSNSYTNYYEHSLLYNSSDLDTATVNYLVSASVYTLFSHSVTRNKRLRRVLTYLHDLSEHDKAILDKYIESQVDYYDYDSDFNSIKFEEDCKVDKTTFYSDKTCKIKMKDKRLFIDINDKEKELPRGLLYYMDLEKLSLPEELINLIVWYETYLEFGLNL